MYKRTILESLIEKGEIKAFSIVGKPTKEVQEAYIKGLEFTNVFKKYEINNSINKFGSGLINIYFPDFIDRAERKRKVLIETCLINVKLKDSEELTLGSAEAIDQLEKIISFLLKEVYDYYQNDLQPVIFRKILGIEEDYGIFSFEDIISLIPEYQVDIARKIGINSSTMSDYKKGRSNPSLQIISKLINLYPLLPWMEYIKAINNYDLQIIK